MSDDRSPICEFDSNRMILRLDMSMPADVKEIDPQVERIMCLIEDMKCAESSGFEVETALREALANAIVHGCAKDPGKSIRLCVACDEQRGVLLVVRDPGEGFDPRSIPSPIQGHCIYEAHGRGIYLINELMDDVEFDRGGTEIRMRKRGDSSSG